MLHDYDKILTRLTIVLQRFYEGETLCVSDLADEFNVSTKTIQRDFNERLVRFPIETVGKKWRMQSGHKLTKERTPEEMLVLEMLENIAESIGTEFGSKARMLFSKLQNQTDNPIYSKTVIEDISGDPALFGAVEEAIGTHRIVSFVFNEKPRKVEPYKIVSFEGYWYLYGAELPEGRLKTYYFREITGFRQNDERFTPSEQPLKILERAINAWFKPNEEPFEVTLNASADIAKYFLRRPLASTQRITRHHSDGSMEISVMATSETEILHEVKKWMPDLTFVAPVSLVEKACALSEQFLKRQMQNGHDAVLEMGDNTENVPNTLTE